MCLIGPAAMTAGPGSATCSRAIRTVVPTRASPARSAHPATAAGDPLFFLLHCNVDRIWAQWQWHEQRFDGEAANTYFYRGSDGDPVSTRRRAQPADTMWPWNGETGGLRPPDRAPRQPLLASRVCRRPARDADGG